MNNRISVLLLAMAVGIVSCGSEDPEEGATGGSGGTGGAIDLGNMGSVGSTGSPGGTSPGDSTGGTSVPGEVENGNPCASCTPLEECVGGARCVAKAVPVPGGYAIDATEVTKSQYQAWLESNPSIEGQPKDCAWNTSVTPSCSWPPGEEGNHPVVCVDWCDARAYCEGAGRRLCGKIGGGPNDIMDLADPSLSEWFAVCSSGGQFDCPQGTCGPGACQHKFSGGQYATEVGRRTSCQSPIPAYAGVFDMSGNVSEWEDSCDGSGSLASCRLRGGSFNYYSYVVLCDSPGGGHREDAKDDVGFRCCSSP
jgi:formylglycine-generating enzyme required for sulfatase activity